MRESRGRSGDRSDQRIFKNSKKCHKPKDIKKRNADKRSADEDDEGCVNVEVDTDPGEAQSTPRTCSSPVKSECSEEGSGTELSASSSITGGNVLQSGGSRSNQFTPPVKKQGISGIKFQPGTRLEAKDLGNGIWYAVKVVEVDWEEEEILIHFEKWSQRYDEWIPMDSSRLRPVMEPPGGFVKKITKIFKVGDKVMATWSDSRKYPATVKTILGNDRYEVLFFDGFSKNIKGGRMIPLKDEELAKIQELQPGIGPSNDITNSPPSLPHSTSQMINTPMAATLGTKEERRERKRKLNVAELFHFKKRPRVDNSTASTSSETSKKARRGSGFGNRGRKKGQWPELSGVDSPSHERVKVEQHSSEVSGEKQLENVEANALLTLDNKRRENITKNRGRCKLEDLTVKRSKSEVAGQRTDEEGKVSGKKIGRKLNKFREGGRRTYSATHSRKEKGLEDSEQRSRKKEGDSDACKPSRAIDDWEPVGEPAYIVDGTDGPRKSIIVADPRIPLGWTRHTIQRMSGHSAGKWDVFFVCPEGRKFRTRHELRLYYEERGDIFPSEQFDFSLGRRKNKAALEREGNNTTSIPPSAGSIKMARQSGIGPTTLNLSSTLAESSSDTPVRRVKTLLPRVRPPHVEGVLPSSVPPISLGNEPVEDASMLSDTSVVFGGLKIQKENDAFRCPKEGCNKNFRKENLLQMHMKHYHPEYNRFVASTPNVADLAYARTVGEPLEELHPRTPRPSVLDKISRFEALRRSRATPPESMTSSPIPSTLPLISTTVAASESSTLPTSPLLSVTPKTVSASVRRRGDTDTSDGTPQVETPDPTAASPCSSLPTEHGEIPPTAIRTLIPVVRPLPAEATVQLTSNDSGGDSNATSAGQGLQNSHSAVEMTPALEERPEERETDPPSLVPISNVSHTKSLRMVRRRHMSDFHMEPLLKKRKSDAEETTQNAVLNGNSNRQTRTESLRREELINCTCGYPEEDGLMIQCDLCMCWQHGLCNNIEQEDHVPEKYVCYICQNPSRERRSKHFLHDQDWLKEGQLPSLSFRSKNPLQVAQNEALLKRSHDLTGTLLQLQTVIHSLRVKVNIAEKKDHPKLYLWAHSWEKGGDETKLDKDTVEENSKKIDKHNGVETSKKKRNFPLHESYNSTMCDGECDVAERSVDLAEGNDISLPNESVDLLGDECDTKDTCFSQETTGSLKESVAQSEDKKFLVEMKTNLPGVTETVVLDSSIEIGTETEVATAEVVDQEGEGTEGPKKRHIDEVEIKSRDRGQKESESLCLNKEKDNSLAVSCSHSFIDKKANFSTTETDAIQNEVKLPICQGNFNVSSSVGNPDISLDISGDANRELTRKAVQSAPQPEAPIDPTECRLTLLDHIEHIQQQVEERLALIESHVDELESMDPSPNVEKCSDSRVKETVQMLLRDLSALYDIATFN